MTAVVAHNPYKRAFVPRSSLCAGETGACQEIMIYVSVTYLFPLLYAADRGKDPTDRYGGRKGRPPAGKNGSWLTIWDKIFKGLISHVPV